MRDGLPRLVELARAYLPAGNTLDDSTFRQRHRFLCWVLGLHLPALAAFGVWRGYGAGHVLAELVAPTACLVGARVVAGRRPAAFWATVGLALCSSLLVHSSGGSIEAHFHFFIIVGLIALYQDWLPFLACLSFTVGSHVVAGALAPELVFSHAAGQSNPWAWVAIHTGAMVVACVSGVVFWQQTESQQRRNVNLAGELATVHARAEQRESVSHLFLNLARRNQALLDRQLALIAELEQRERDADALGELFRLDHLATRIRRNAESLLVLSGDGPARRWCRPVPLGEVARAAAAEVEDFRRVEVLVNDKLDITGHAVADLAHLLAELIENATTFSPPNSEVRLRSHVTTAAGAQVLSIEDVGIGMSDTELLENNARLDDPPDIDLRRSSMLGFHVVARLARRYGIRVTLAHTPGGGLTALVTLPADLVVDRRNDPPEDDDLSALLPARGPGHPLRHGPPAAAPVPDTPEAFTVATWPLLDAHAPSPDGLIPGPDGPAPGVNGRLPGADGRGRPAGADIRGGTRLTHRVPGAGLAPSLRREPTQAAAPPPARATPDHERSRSMLSRFQSNQRDGRAAAEQSPPVSPGEER